MSIIREDVTSYRAYLYQFLYFDSVVPLTYWGAIIDTSGYQGGVYFVFFKAWERDGTCTFRARIQHSDTLSGFVDVGPEHLVYGREDGVLPLVENTLAPGDFVAREGVRNTKRYLRAGLDNDPDSWMNGRLIGMAIMSSDLIQTPSDASYS